MDTPTINKEAEIDLARVFYLFLKKRRLTAVTALALAAVMGAYKAVDQIKTEFNLKQILLYGALGAVLGVVTVACVVLGKELASSRITCPEDMSRRYNLFVIGCLHVWTNKRGSGLDHWADRRLGRRSKIDTEEACRLMAAKIMLLSGSGETEILMCGTGDVRRIQTAAEMIRRFLPGDMRLRALANPVYSPEAAMEIARAGVILTEEIDRSEIREIDKIVELVSAGGRRIMGCILL